MRSRVHLMPDANIAGMQVVRTLGHFLGQDDLNGASILVRTYK